VINLDTAQIGNWKLKELKFGMLDWFIQTLITFFSSCPR